mmetsp:Transcript_20350/g.43606  ORF Transcript_20350/g.43606 Transcript_20350/m.43606 type:complete len:758 (-) Transcript_20350:100-2373(-)|eukprot:CAMPEP_0172552686 /NCGR_PEP_ID=MMETSP1067-20121228/46896_1 /TAXON_ID=265564 ORGANISM="Thalassiosira punctigera, Strain Tpunct2005C2" /NCGR_SAMPLE_ID=MMETSP1067 /ASSEMBLY_ACC=CAM_ASM_000444 /LENGTH=757 /DNA_ID=CAMNT_0013340729 /DNA_START=325 /DNA_END=2598 /DNA_ORIENTATION=-
MINILSETSAAVNFERQRKKSNNNDNRREGEPDKMFDYSGELMEAQLDSTKHRISHSKAPGVLGHVVKPGFISFYSMNGKTYAVAEGRWWLMKNPIKAHWFKDAKNQTLDDDFITVGQVRIVRVLPGEVGLVREQGTEVLLDVGTHVFNSGIVSVQGKVKYDELKNFNHGRYHYLRVDRGYFARVWAVVMIDGMETVVPRLLGQGTHYIANHMFKFDGFSKVSDPVIAHGSIHKVNVVKGQIAKCIQDTTSRLLGEGEHTIESTDFQVVGFEDIMKSHCIQHGTITILRVTKGKVALAWKDNDPIFITEPGLYEFDSADFSFDSFRDAEERLIQLGAKKIVQVQTGRVGVTYDNGVLKVLRNGTHEIDSATHIVHRFLSIQEKSIRLATLSGNEKLARSMKRSQAGKQSDASAQPNKSKLKQGVSDLIVDDKDADLTICETKDLVKVGIRADVFYSISDPEKCILKIDTDELEDLVRETAIATLTNIIRSTALNQIAQSNSVSAGGLAGRVAEDLKESKVEAAASGSVKQPAGKIEVEVDGNAPPASAPMAEFFDKTHDEFMSKLHDDFQLRYGVNISNIRIEAFKIMDDDLAEQISKHALTTAQIENEMANLEGMSLISTQKERTSAEVKNISALADAVAKKTTADAENQRMIDQAMAEGEALRIKAKAEAESIKLKAEAEAERAEMIARTDLGKQEALLSIYSDMVVKSNSGVEKIIYLDPSVNKDSPFALSSMQNLNNDLHALTKLGIAANGTN